MTIRILLATAVLVGLPALAMAECGFGHVKQQSVASCPDGQVWDGVAQSCVEQVTG